MISITPFGKTAFQDAVQALPSSVHLYTDDGELKGHGYKPVRINASEWDSMGRYPEIMWVFDAENTSQNVLGYYVVTADGRTLWSEPFDEAYVIQNKGDRIGVSLTMNFIGALGS